MTIRTWGIELSSGLPGRCFPKPTSPIIWFCSLHITDQHAQPRRCTQKQKKSELLIVVQKWWWQASSKYSLIKHYHFHYKYHEQNLASRNFPSDHPKCTHGSGKGVAQPKRMVGRAKGLSDEIDTTHYQEEIPTHAHCDTSTLSDTHLDWIELKFSGADQGADP